jgi:hypothetical protein
VRVVRIKLRIDARFAQFGDTLAAMITSANPAPVRRW